MLESDLGTMVPIFYWTRKSVFNSMKIVISTRIEYWNIQLRALLKYDYSYKRFNTN